MGGGKNISGPKGGWEDGKTSAALKVSGRREERLKVGGRREAALKVGGRREERQRP